MKRVLIFYGAYGAGHFSAARSIKEHIDSHYPDVETKIVDCIEYVNKFINKISTKAYDELSKNVPWAWEKVYNGSQSGPLEVISNTSNKIMSVKLKKLFEDFNPDIVISTHPFGTQMTTILKKKGLINCKIATVLTDYAPHNQWLVNSDYIDYFFVAHSGMRDELIKLGIESFKVFATGIPLSNKFLRNYNKDELLSSFGLKKDIFTILFFAGGSSRFSKGSVYDIFNILIDNFSNFQIITLTGNSEKLKNDFDEILKQKAPNSTNIKILKFTDRVPELMSISNIVISKPGGLTTTESISCGLPLIVIDPIPGQEEENANFLEDNNVAIWIKKGDNIENVLKNLFNSPEKLVSMKISAKLMAKKYSTQDICRIFLEN